MKNLLSHPDYKGWSINSLAWHAVKQHLLFACTSTWYKYVHILGLSRILVSSRRKKHKLGIRASAPHELWHMDITIFKTLDNISVYIYILMDNFSRAILGWNISLKKSAEITFKTLRTAYQTYIAPFPYKYTEVLIMSDGGSENEALIVQDYINDPDNSLKHLRALVDIDFSNSMIEACNKTIKYRFLYQHVFPDYNSSTKLLPSLIREYNEVRPHHTHKYLTPIEVLNGKRFEPNRYKAQFEQARLL